MKPTVRQRRLGSQLRQLREQAGLTCKKAGELLQLAESTISRIEVGERGIRTPDLKELLNAYGLEDEAKRNGLIRLALDASRRDWFSAYDDILGESYRDYLSLESEATSIRYYHPQCVPGLLQTDDLALAVISEVHRDARTVERMAEARDERKHILRRETPPSLSVVIDEQVVRRPTGGRAVMRAQLQHLLTKAQASNIEIRVLPQSLEAGVAVACGPFVILSFPEGGAEAVFLENLLGGDYLDNDAAIRSYSVVFEQLQAVAMDPDASQKLITAAERDLSRDE